MTACSWYAYNFSIVIVFTINSWFCTFLQLVQQEEAAIDIQRRIVQESTEQTIAAERAFFVADRGISHFAEHIEDVLESKKLMEKLDADK